MPESKTSIVTGTDIRPVPDPTILTTQQLQREISVARELVETRITGIRDVLDTRLGAIDVATALLQKQTDKFPDAIISTVKQLQSLHEEKFRSIETQFVERDIRTEQTARDSKVAVDAALQAAKEAVGEQNKSNALAIAKSEATFTKQIDQIGTLIASLTKGLDDKIDDIKGRLGAMENSRKGAGDAWGFVFGAGGLIVAVVAVAASLLKH